MAGVAPPSSPSTRDASVVPEEKDQRIVQTPYGRGLVVRIRPPRDGDDKSSSLAVQEVQLLEWDAGASASASASVGGGRGRRSRRGPPVLYTSNELQSVTPMVGDDVVCQHGRGRIVEIIDVPVVAPPEEKKVEEEEEDDGGEEEKKEPASPNSSSSSSPRRPPLRRQKKYVVKLTSWRLAGRSSVLCHLTGSQSVCVVRKKTLREMDAHERVEHASSKKSLANPQFVKKHYELALKLYAEAVDSVRYVQHDSHSSNELRADLVEVMVTCSNNAATCCVRLKRWSEASRYAKNALVLLDALDGKRGMKIHGVLNRGGVCDAKLFGEWRAKSYLVGARCYAEWGENEKAIESLKLAKKVIGEFHPPAAAKKEEADEATETSRKHLAAQEKEVNRLMSTCVQRRKVERRKERQRAKAMFGGGGVGGEKTKAKGGATSGDANDASPSAGKDDDAVAGGRSNDDDVDASSKKEGSTTTTAAATIPASVDRAKRNALVKSVSFASDVKGSSSDGHDSDGEDETEPWYREHAEALILLGAVAGLAGLASMLLLRSGGRK